MNYEVFIIDNAEEDLYEIFNYVMVHDSALGAEKLLENLEKTCYSLSTFPGRGHIPPELERISIFAYKEINCKSYRIIYQIVESSVYIHCILDGRRNLQQLLQERLLR